MERPCQLFWSLYQQEYARSDVSDQRIIFLLGYSGAMAAPKGPEKKEAYSGQSGFFFYDRVGFECLKQCNFASVFVHWVLSNYPGECSVVPEAPEAPKSYSTDLRLLILSCDHCIQPHWRVSEYSG